MPLIRLETFIDAPLELCFDLSRSIDAHMQSTARTGERAIAGRTSGLISLGETVTWQARHFGIRQKLRVKITAMQPHHYFRDEMERGAFARMWHEHRFTATGGSTMMTDYFFFRSPFGIIGKWVDWLVLRSYLQRFLEERNAVLKQLAEASVRSPAAANANAAPQGTAF